MSRQKTTLSMTLKTKILSVCAALAALVFIGAAVLLNRGYRPGPNGGDGATTFLGGLFGRAAAVSNLKQRMGELREVFGAVRQFADQHQDDLPKTLADLRPNLPVKLAYLDDDHWELPSRGKMTPLVNGPQANQAILLQEKDVFPEHPKIVVYADGHIEYRK